jgi:hypothetical protein
MAGARDFYLLHIIQIGFGAHILLSSGYWELFAGVKQSGCKSDHSPPSSAKVKNMWIYKSTP